MTIYPQDWYPAAKEKGVVGRFNKLAVLDIAASQAKGEEIYKEIIVLEAKTHLSNDYVPEKLPADPILRKRMIDRFPMAWEIFQGQMPQPTGTPLAEKFHDLTMNPQTRMRHELAGINYWEQIADLTDAGCVHLGFGETKLREDVMLAMGLTPPGRPQQNMALSMGTTAAQALSQLPNAASLLARIAELESKLGAVPDASTLGQQPVQATPPPKPARKGSRRRVPVAPDDGDDDVAA